MSWASLAPFRSFKALPALEAVGVRRPPGMMQEVSNCEPVMWGSAIIGFGTYHYVYESGREGDMVVIGFSPRKQNISIYLMGGLNKVQEELSKLGKYKTGKGCLYIKSLSDVNAEVLKKIFAKALKEAHRKSAHTS
jgi:uncharacterized protein DUF1801